MSENSQCTAGRILWGMFCGIVCGLAFAAVAELGRKAEQDRAIHLTEDQLDEMIEETFPASDAPSY